MFCVGNIIGECEVGFFFCGVVFFVIFVNVMKGWFYYGFG